MAGLWVVVGGWRRVVGGCVWLAQDCGWLWVVGAGLWVVVCGWRRVVGGCGWLAQGGGGLFEVGAGWWADSYTQLTVTASCVL